MVARKRKARAMKRKYIYPIIVVLALMTSFVLWLVTKPLQAPSLQLTTIDGHLISLDKPFTKMLLLNFWATDCPGCVREMPHLISFYQRHQGDMDVIAIAMPYDSPTEVLTFSKNHALPFPVALDAEGRAVKSMKVMVTPTSFLLDKNGHVLRQFIGEIDFVRLEKLITMSKEGTS